MGYNPGTFGWDAYTAATKLLLALDISYTEELQDTRRSCGFNRDPLEGVAPMMELRIATFTSPKGKEMVVEEYLAVDDGASDGMSWLDVEVYEKGNRPHLYTRVLCDGREHYPEVYEANDGTGELITEPNGTSSPTADQPDRVRDFLYRLNDGTVHPMHELDVEDPGEWECARCSRSLCSGKCGSNAVAEASR